MCMLYIIMIKTSILSTNSKLLLNYNEKRRYFKSNYIDKKEEISSIPYIDIHVQHKSFILIIKHELINDNMF